MTFMRRGEEGSAVARGLEHRRGYRRHGALAVGPADMKIAQLPVGIAQKGKQRLHALQPGLDSKAALL